MRSSGERLGGLTAALAQTMQLPAALPVFVGIGDNQASFLGSVGDPRDAMLVNVGTGGQVAVFTPSPPTSVFMQTADTLVETRPFPRDGYLLVAAGLSGGAAYAALESFFRRVGRDLFGVEAPLHLYDVMNRLAAATAAGAAGVVCEPYFEIGRAHV